MIEKASQFLPQAPTTAHSDNCANCETRPDSTFREVEGYPLCGRCAEKHEADLRAITRRRNRQRFHELHGRGLVGDEFLEVGFHKSNAEFEARNPEAWKAARAWRGGNVYAFGPMGTGKSFMAQCLLMRAFLRGASVGIVSARRFAKAMDRFDEGGELGREWLRVKILLLDDLDKAAWSPERLGALWELMDTRMKRKNTTIITSNVDAKTLRDALREAAGNNHSLADASLDRLKPCTTIKLNGASLR